MSDVSDLVPIRETAPVVQPVRSASATPADLVRYAMDSGADIDRLERLYQLQVQWEERESKKAYNEAFANFKSEAVRVIRERKVTDGPLRGRSYAELYSWVNAVTPALSKHGLSASWKITKDDKDWLEVTCYLKHSGGYFESVSMGGPPDSGGAKNAIQARASTVSYLERHTLKAITGLSDQEDDNDGAGGAEYEQAAPAASLVPAELMNGLRETKTDKEALDYWFKHRDSTGAVKSKPYEAFKDAVAAHRVKLKEQSK